MLATGKITTGPEAIMAYLIAKPFEYFRYACIGTSVFTAGNVKYRHKRQMTRIEEPESQFDVAFQSKEGARPHDW